MRSIVGAFQENMDACVASRRYGRKETMSCQEATERDTENTEPDPGMMQSVVEHQVAPKEDAILKPVKGRKKRRRDRKPAAGRRGEQNEMSRGDRGFRRKSTTACRKVCSCATVGRRKRNLLGKTGVYRRRNKDDPLCKSGTRQGPRAAETRKRRHCTENRKGRTEENRRLKGPE
jgi:hypothetical protein